MLGQDVEYSNRMEDSELLATAKDEKRILLTRDFELYQRAVGKGVEAFYLEGLTGEEKLAEVAKRYGLPLEIDMSESRCPKCNSLIHPISCERAADQVEKNTLEHYREFWQCSKCQQVYWQGAHWARIIKSLTEAKEMLTKQ
jgi:uncharacterized protein with PIN domain